jgi:ferritin
MISKTIEKAINDQTNLELYSAYIYLSMSAYFTAANLDGFAHWMKLQAQEELGHSLRLFDFVQDREGSVDLGTVKAPPTTWDSPLAACQQALEHERLNTKQINELMKLAFAEEDHATRIFLQWFVNEQVEEEASASKLADRVKMVQDNAGALFILDQELSKRQLGPDE